MKKIATSALLLFALIGCKKEDIDPRDQYLGSYDIVSKQTSPVVTESQAIMIVAKSEKANGLTLSFSGGTLPATLSANGTFTLTPYTNSFTIREFPVSDDYEGEGAISGNELVMNVRVTRREVGKTTKSTATVTGTKR